MRNSILLCSLLLGCGDAHTRSPETPDAAAADVSIADAGPWEDVGSLDAPDALPALPHWETTRSAIACTEHTATALGDGDVLLVGTCSLDGLPAWALRYDARDRTATALEPLERRAAHAAVALADGGALVIAGLAADVVDRALASTERFDADTNTFRPGPVLREPRAWAGALRSGTRIVVAGGRSAREPRELLASVEQLDLLDDSVTFLRPLRAARERMVLGEREGEILAIGGVDTTASSTLEHLRTGGVEMLSAWCPLPAAAPGELVVACGELVLDLTSGVDIQARLEHAHMAPAAVRLADGALLVLGSSPWTANPPALPERVEAERSTLLPSPEHGYLWPTATLLPDGSVLIVGEEASEILVW